ILKVIYESLVGLGNALSFLGGVVRHICRGHIRGGEVLKQIYEQGWQSAFIIAITSLASGLVIALQGYIVTVRFGAKETISQLVAWSLVRELCPVFTAIIFSAKAGARITAEMGTMNVNDQMLATRTLGVDPIEFLIVPRMLACFLVVPILTILSEIVGIFGGYLVGVYEANIPGVYYLNQTFRAIRYIDFFSGFIKVFFFAILIGWICCYQGYNTKGGSLGVGQYTTKAVAYSIIFVLISNTILTKIIITFWR
ncbi:MAG: ABC transporter permease, partial [Candidatus Omnitrophica bacterium]|nr:ABC transporter permease [Candidatus Omnitrophota bacterium]